MTGGQAGRDQENLGKDRQLGVLRGFSSPEEGQHGKLAELSFLAPSPRTSPGEGRGLSGGHLLLPVLCQELRHMVPI